jgi:hypothetical protein
MNAMEVELGIQVLRWAAEDLSFLDADRTAC